MGLITYSNALRAVIKCEPRRDFQRLFNSAAGSNAGYTVLHTHPARCVKFLKVSLRETTSLVIAAFHHCQTGRAFPVIYLDSLCCSLSCFLFCTHHHLLYSILYHTAGWRVLFFFCPSFFFYPTNPIPLVSHYIF